eukprot:5025373-Pyramimonas_sp.AAC.1
MCRWLHCVPQPPIMTGEANLLYIEPRRVPQSPAPWRNAKPRSSSYVQSSVRRTRSAPSAQQ